MGWTLNVWLSSALTCWIFSFLSSLYHIHIQHYLFRLTEITTHFFYKKKKGWTIWGSLINPIMSVLAFKKHWPGEIKKFLLFSRCFGNWRIRTTLVTLPLPQVFPPTEVQLAQWHPKDSVKKESVKLNLWLLYVAEQWWSLRQTAVLARISSAIYLVLTEEERSSATLN